MLQEESETTMNLLLTGASGLLGAYLLREARSGPDNLIAWSGSNNAGPWRPVDLADADAVAVAFREAQPDAVLHAGAISSAAQCYRDPVAARRVNTEATALLAALAATAGARLVFVSTDLVFDGATGWYDEGQPTSPLSVYGRTKADAEAVVLESGGVVVRVSLLFGPSLTGRAGFFDQQLTALASDQPITLFEDEWRTPLGYLHAARALLALVRSTHSGVFHVGGPERTSRLEMGRRLAAYLGRNPARAVPASRREALGEPRPADTSLSSNRLRALFPSLAWPGYEEALAEMGVRTA